MGNHQGAKDARWNMRVVNIRWRYWEWIAGMVIVRKLLVNDVRETIDEAKSFDIAG